MADNPQHYHRCKNSECEESWICIRISCGIDFCDACERRQFEDYHEAHGFTVAQPELPELETKR